MNDTHENISNLILERLNRIDYRLQNMESGVDAIKTDISILKESVRRIDHRIGYMDSYMAGFHSELRWHKDEFDGHRSRLESLEEFQTRCERDHNPDHPET